MAALLAQQDFVATREFLTAVDGGLYNTYSNGGTPEAAVADLGTRWELEQIALRLWPCASGLQGMVTAMFDLVEEHRVGLDQVKTVRVSLPRTIYDMHGIFPRYKGKFEALLSTHYVVAAILHDKALTLTQFEPARYEDPRLRTFAAEQVAMKLDTTLTGVQAVVEADTTDGKTLAARCEHSKGSPENPLTRAQIEEKFRIYANGRLPAAQIDEVISTVARLEDLESTRRLMDLLRVVEDGKTEVK
jgi:2-methylcitrate dehydratase PrpD